MTGPTEPPDTDRPAASPGGPTTAPVGTVTLLFTDIEGSTRLLERLRGGYAAVLEDHRGLLQEVFARHHGHVVDSSGDAFFVAFPSASTAVSCAVEAQRALAARAWPHGVTVRVRMGLHTGEPLASPSGYVGMDVHRAARIGAAGHGGQILLSQTTRDLAADELPVGTTLGDLGEHRLKDLRGPVRIFELKVDGLTTAFPPLQTMPTDEAPPTPGDPPFRGLQVFEEADADLFYGREALTDGLAETLIGWPLVAIVGASGSGKSSVLRAGLIPALRRDRQHDWRIHLLTPTAHPLESLAVSLVGDDSVAAAARLADDLASDARSLRLLAGRMLAASSARVVDGQRVPPRVLVAVDQLEELFTLCRDEAERRAFIDNLLNGVGLGVANPGGSDGPVRVVMTLRADFYAHLAQYGSLREAIAGHQVYIGPMDRESMRRAIEEPARQGGWEFVPGLVDLLLHDAGDEPGSLPLLSHALLETWRRRRGTTMTLRGYAESGGVRGAIATTAERVFQAELSAEQQDIARGIFVRLTELGDGTADTRRRVARAELIPPGDTTRAAAVGAALEVLADARLVTTGEETVEVAHEALIREWPRLREWLGEDREGLRLHRRVTEAAAEWEALDRDPGVLMRGTRLAQANEWAASHPGQLNDAETAFLAASRGLEAAEFAERDAAREKELRAAEALAEAERRRAEEAAGSARRLRRYAALLVGAAAVSIGLAIVSFLATRQADQSARVATARELFAASSATVETDPELSILLALEAVRTTQAVDGSVLPEADDVLHQAISASRIVETLPGVGTTVAWSPGADLLAAAGTAGTGSIEVRSTTTGEALASWQAQGSDIYDLAFSGDGGLLYTAGALAPVRAWDVATQTSTDLPTPPSFGDSAVGDVLQLTTVTVSPDDRFLAALSQDWFNETTTAVIWDLRTGSVIREIEVSPAVGGQSFEAAFSHDGSRIAVAGWGVPTVAVFEVATGDQLLTLPDPGASEIALPFRAVSWSPVGSLIATAGDDGVVRTWDGRSGRPVDEFRVDVAGVNDVEWAPDGMHLIAAGESGTADLWEIDADGGRRLLGLAGGGASVREAWFDLDGTRVLGVDQDGVARMWDVGLSGDAELMNLPAAGGRESDLAYSPDARALVASASEGRISIFDPTDGAEIRSLDGHDPGEDGVVAVTGVAVSPDGRWISSAGLDGTVRLWDAATGRAVWRFDGHAAEVLDVDFSPDGSLLASASLDSTTRVLDVASGAQLETLRSARAQMLSEVAVAVRFSADGSSLASAGYDGWVTIWDPVTWTERRSIRIGAPVTEIDLDPAGRLAVATTDGTTGLWDPSTGERLLSLVGPAIEVSAVAFSADGTLLATGSIDGTLRLWDVTTGAMATALPGHGASVSAVAFSPDGSHVSSIGADGRVRAWAIDLDELIGIAQSELTRTLTEGECQRYLHLDTCPATDAAGSP